jgi:hypothetical protein
MELAFTEPFRFLDLPWEIRRLVFRELFRHSRIAFEVESDPIPHGIVSLENYHPEITFTAHQIRNESVELLEDATTLYLDPVGMEKNLPEYITARNVHMLTKIRRLSILLCMPEDYRFTNTVTSFPGLETINVCGAFLDESDFPEAGLGLYEEHYDPGMTLELVDRSDSAANTTAVHEIDSLEALERVSQGWIRTTRKYIHQHLPNVLVNIAVTVPYSNDPQKSSWKVRRYNELLISAVC